MLKPAASNSTLSLRHPSFSTSQLFSIIIMRKLLQAARHFLKRIFDKINNQGLRVNLLQAIPFWIASFITGMIAVFYAKIFAWAEQLNEWIVLKNHFLLFIVTPVCFLCAWWLVRRFASYARGSGIPQVIASVELAGTEYDPA